ncbi:hypothetical protein ACIRBX_17750 [Kitasatospora sp. NPDC096147]|uniref:hypothetical protein n=1 Tax=Kitasatospora sp. NPDC096147 TaxID=3364093 RepID=UPI003813E26B
MSRAVAQALEEAARRIGRQLGEQAGPAVAGLYRWAGDGTREVVRHVEDADRAHGREIAAVAERLGGHPACAAPELPPMRREPERESRRESTQGQA